MTALSDAKADLKDINKTLKRLESKGVGLADAAQGLRRVSNVLGVALQELEKHEKRMAALDNDLGDHLLSHEKDYPTPKEVKEYLAFMRGERAKDKGVSANVS